MEPASVCWLLDARYPIALGEEAGLVALRTLVRERYAVDFARETDSYNSTVLSTIGPWVWLAS